MLAFHVQPEAGSGDKALAIICMKIFKFFFNSFTLLLQSIHMGGKHHRYRSSPFHQSF
jgi:hypothetical protein